MEPITKVRISRFTDEDIDKISDCTVNKQFTATTTIFDNTAYDKRMGVFREGELCETCITNYKNCSGGMGKIRLPVPYIFPENIKYVVFLANIICHECSKLLISPNEMYLLTLLKKSVTKFYLIPYYICKLGKICPKCGIKPLFLRDQAGRIVDHKDKPVDLKALKIMIENIDLESLEALKIHINYKSLLIQNFPVVSPYLRIYTVTRDTDHNDYGDISTMYNNIVKDINSNKYDELHSKIELMLTNKNKKKFPNFSNKTIHSIKEMIQGKDGMITNNLSGKRVDYSGRTTITGGPELSIGEFGVPEQMANYITVPVYITDNSKEVIENMYEYYKPIKILKADGTRIRIINKNILFKSAQKGDYFERPLKNGDIVLVNRQPTLRPESIMAMKVRVMKGINTFRLPIPCTTPYNADFDGDEMNMHVTQNYLTWAECQELMYSEKMIIDSQNGNPIINITQDGKVGLYMITKKGTEISRGNLFDTLLMCDTILTIDKINSWNVIHKENLTFKSLCFPGLFLISCFIDEVFSYEGSGIIINRGIIVSKGRWNSKIFNGIIHSYCFKVSKTSGCRLIDCIQKASYLYLTRTGFSLGLKDCNVLEFFERPAEFDSESYLSIVDVQLSPLLDDIENNLICMIKSGAKGSINNIIQISHALGQQSFDGNVIEKEMITNRTLSCFQPGDTSIESRGFIYSSFLKGLKEYEVLFHGKTGRKGVTDSSITVAESGYLYKRITKFLEDLMIRYDGSVRTNVKGYIIQFLFGGDGIDIQNLPRQFSQNELKLMGVSKQNLFVYLSNSSFYLTKKGYHPIFYFLRQILFEMLYHYCPDDTKQKITVDKIKKFELFLTKILLTPGTPIGLKASQNVGEVCSQILLKSFHHTGIKDKDISTGVKRLTQLLTSSKKKVQKSICIKTRPDFFEYNLMKTALSEVDTNAKCFLYSLMETACVVKMNKNRNINLSELIVDKSLEIKEVSVHIRLICSFEYKPLDNEMISLVSDKIKGIIDATVNAMVTTDDRTTFDIYFKYLSDLDAVLKYEQILDINVVIGTLSSLGELKLKHDDFEIIFYGEKLTTILCLDFIDKSHTQSSDPLENTTIFGIEAGRRSLLEEVCSIFTFDGASIDSRYIHLICDLTCRSGKILGITWSNLVETQFDPLCSALFERAISRINALSVKGVVDNCDSLMSNIFLGKLGKMGTGSFELLS